MMGFCESTAQQKTSNPQDILTACSRYAGFAYPALLAECGYDAVLPKSCIFRFHRGELWLPTAMSVFGRPAAGGQVVSITINEVVSEPTAP